MLLFTKKLWITKHCIERYSERVRDKNGNPFPKPLSHSQIRKRIIDDFQIKNVRYKTLKESDGTFQVFTKSARLYVCQEKDKTIIVKTIIQQTQEKSKEFKEVQKKYEKSEI